MNSEPSNLSNPPSMPDILPNTSPVPSSTDATFDPNSVNFKEAPLEWLLDVSEKTLVHDMTPDQVMAYIQRLSVLRSSAQSRKAALTKEPGEKKAKVTKKDSVALALDLLKQLT